jgi:uncharacterized protein YcbK (DUF882 family)
MKTESINIKYRNPLNQQKTFSLDYQEPETLEEAFSSDGKEKVFNLYLGYRLIKFRDEKRREKESSAKKAMLEKLNGEETPEILAAKKLLGLA